MPERDWKAQNTYAIILGLGLDEWAEPDNPAWKRHAALADFFQKAGLPRQNLRFWEDKDGHPEQMRKALPEFLASTEEGSLLFFYYAGHGDIDQEEDDFYFCHPTTDDCIYAEDLFDMLEEDFNGDQVMILADCCYSGALADWVEERDADFEYAVLTSSTSDIESTGNWTFTDCVLDALGGKAAIDADQNGTITFQELCDYVLERMEKVEKQPAEYDHTEDFDPDFRLAIVRR